MSILIYEWPEAPPKRRFIAQHERMENSLYLTCHGPTADIARAKAQLMLDYASLDPKERTGFKLKERLEALNGGNLLSRKPRRDVDDLA